MRSLALGAALGAALATLACSAAAPGIPRVTTPRSAPPADIDRADVAVRGADGLALSGQRWRPHRGAPRGVVVIHHGLADHSDRYAGFAAQLVRAGFAVWAYDMRGHGRSAGPRVDVASIDELVADLDAFLGQVRAAEPGLPVFVYGHSLGGLTVALLAIERQPAVAGVVLAAPGIAFDTGPLAPAAVRLVAAIAPGAPILETPHRDFSRDPAVVAALDADPLIHQRNGAARTARAALDGVARVWAHPERLIAPLLVVHGTADRVTAPSGSRDLVARAADATLRLYDGLAHDVLHDRGGDAVAADVLAWIEARVEGAPVAAAPRPAGPLLGDRRPGAAAIELDARGVRRDGDLGASGGVRLRLGLGGPVGYVGGVDLRAGYLGGARWEAELHALGVGWRRGGLSVALTGGAGFGGLRGAGAIRIPLELAVEASLGPARLLARGALAWEVRGPNPAGAVGFADEVRALVGVRLGRDVAYWSSVRAGAGPYLAATFADVGGSKVLGLALGFQLWGAN